MWKFQCLLFVWKRSYIYYIICRTVPSSEVWINVSWKYNSLMWNIWTRSFFLNLLFSKSYSFLQFCFWNPKILIFYVITFSWYYPWMVLVLLDYWFCIHILFIWRETSPRVEYLTWVKSQQNGKFHYTKTNRLYEN